MTGPSAPRLRRFRLADATDAERRVLTERTSTATPEVRARARDIVDAVRQGGDAALRDANARFGGGLTEPAEAPALRVPTAELRAARDALPTELRDGLEQMAANIETFHAVETPPAEQWVEVEPGVRVGPRLARPGPRRCLCSRRHRGLPIVVADECHPGPARGRGYATWWPVPPERTASCSPALLGAAGLMEVEEFWVMGGAQAVGALAYGTESIGRVDKIVGPGNAWVTAAKLEVLDRCAIDMPAGPTEVMVVADDTADPVHVAADLLSQAEHGPDSPSLLVTPSESLADAVEAEIARQLPTLLRRDTLAASVAAAGTVVLTADIDRGSRLRRRVRAGAPVVRGR